MKSKSDTESLTPEELRRIRLDARLTQAALASRFGLSDGRIIRRYEAGPKPPPGPILKLYHLLRTGKL